MVHPYLRRRENPALVDYPSAELEEVLVRTLASRFFKSKPCRLQSSRQVHA